MYSIYIGQIVQALAAPLLMQMHVTKKVWLMFGGLRTLYKIPNIQGKSRKQPLRWLYKNRQ